MASPWVAGLKWRWRATFLLIATAHARLGLPEPRVGVVAATTGGVHRLARRMLLSIAMGYILTGEKI